MRRIRVILFLVQLALVAGLGLALHNRIFPLGVPGEWEWERMRFESVFVDVVLALAGLLAYVAFATLGWRSLARSGGKIREGAWLLSLIVAAVFVQGILASGAPAGYGLAKWAIALHDVSSSGYYTVAKLEIRDPKQFLADYPKWVQNQVVPRMGAHPPGLFLLTHAARHLFQTHPQSALRFESWLPETVRTSFRQINDYDPMPIADRAALGLIGALTLVGCVSTVLPLYLLARSYLPSHWSWAAAVLWPLVPSTMLFQPAADTAFPFVSTSALALACWAARGRPAMAHAMALLCGILLAFGLLFTLAFLPVGLTIALIFASASDRSWRQRLALVLATGAGFLGVTFVVWGVSGVNPFVVWWWNRVNHARFYHAFPRSYTRWVLVDLVELTIALGLPAVLWAVAGLSLRTTPRLVWATLAVLALLNFGGLTLSEVARLWLPWMPPLLVASACGLSRLEAGPWTFSSTAALLGLQTMILHATIQVVYPAQQ